MQQLKCKEIRLKYKGQLNLFQLKKILYQKNQNHLLQWLTIQKLAYSAKKIMIKIQFSVSIYIIAACDHEITKVFQLATFVIFTISVVKILEVL